MKTAIEFLKANPVFHIATVDGNKARVRPFGFKMERNNTLYFCTGKAKDVYKQLVQNPDIEISAMGPDNMPQMAVSMAIIAIATRIKPLVEPKR